MEGRQKGYDVPNPAHFDWIRIVDPWVIFTGPVRYCHVYIDRCKDLKKTLNRFVFIWSCPREDFDATDDGSEKKGSIIECLIDNKAVVLRFYDERFFEKIARISRISLSLAKMRVYRGLEKLQRVMKQYFR